MAPRAAFMAACAIASITPGIAQAQSSAVWSHDSAATGENWNALVVSLGNHGTQVLSAFGPFTDYTRLFSVYDQDPPAPVWQHDTTAITKRHRVASAKEADVHVTLHDVDSGDLYHSRNVVVRKFSSASGTPDWEYTFPTTTNGHDGTNVHVSADGQRIVALMYNVSQNETDVAVFGPDSNVPLTSYSINAATALATSLLSADGTTLYLRSSAKIVLFDLVNGTKRFDTILFGGAAYSDAISGDGSIFAYSSYSHVKVYREVAGAFVDPDVITLPGNNYCGKLDLSDDGRVLGLGFNYFDSWLRVRVQARDLETGDVLVDDNLVGSGSLQNLASALKVSADGSHLAVGLWGDEADLVPEVAVYSTNDGVQVASFHTPGSVNAMDFSSDGSTLAVASKRVHANTVASGGRIEVFEIGASDFTMSGLPSIGSTVEFTFEARTGKSAALFYAPRLAGTPTVIPTVGTLRFNQDEISSTPMGIIPAGDKITSEFEIPNNVALIGSTLYFQGFASAPRSLSKGWVAMTILP